MTTSKLKGDWTLEYEHPLHLFAISVTFSENIPQHYVKVAECWRSCYRVACSEITPKRERQAALSKRTVDVQ